MTTIEIKDGEVLAALGKLIERMQKPGPALKYIGERLAESTKRRFRSSTSPDGVPWAPNTETTLLRYLGAFKSSFSGKTGRLTKAGSGRASGKKPLIGETKALSTTITYQVHGDELLIGSPMEYAVTQQFGARKGQYGTTSRGSPIPWGDIPARPFLGVSGGDKEIILDVISDYLAESWGK